MNDSTALFILTSVIVWPLCNLLALIVAPNKSIATQFACLAGLPAAIAALLLPLTSQPLYFDLMLKGALGLDETGRGFLLFSSALWCAAGIYAKASIARDKQFSFYVFYLLAMSGNFALIFAQDILTFYGGYALMSLAFYGLLFAQDSTQTLNSQRLASAAKIYIAFTMISELSIFAAIALIEGSVGVTDFTSIQAMLAVSPYLNAIVLFLVIGFGIKTAVIGLHMWLPLTYCAAPIAATAILAGALAKVGVLGWLRMFPALEQPLFEWGTLLVVLGSVAAFYGVLIGITQRTLKAILAYSSISQLGIITLLCGLLLLIPAHRIELTAAITLYALHHGLNKGSLFLGVGLCRAERCTRRWMWLLMMLPALSLAGAPLSSGMLAKLALKEQIHALPEGRYALLSLAVTLMSIGTAVLVVKFLYHCKPNSATHHAHP
ncbi:MAG TPA: proton-conducting transporter membrane subunit, partial [Marinagarivorans sp.]